MMLDFKDWLMKEEGTSTACVASFARPVMGVVRRAYATIGPMLNRKMDLIDDKRKKKKKSH